MVALVEAPAKTDIRKDVVISEIMWGLNEAVFAPDKPAVD